MSNTVPEGWSIKPLSDLAVVDKESLKNSTKPDFKFRYIDIASVKTGIINVPPEHITFVESPSRARKRVRRGDVLMSTVRPNLQAFAHFDLDGDDFVASTGFAVITASKSNDGKFLYQSILSDDVGRQVAALVAGSNYPAISSSNVKNLEIITPPPPEQQKIATILFSVDDVIETTRAQIDKLKDLKTGMVQELLTKGIGHTEFKDSPVGRIPVGWDVVCVGDLFEDRIELTNDEVNYVLSSLTIEDGLVKKPERYIRDFLIIDKNKDSYKVVHPQDFLFNPMNLRWGAIARSNQNRPVIVSKYYNILKPKIDGDFRFYEHAFKSEIYLQRYESIATGTLIEKKRVHWSALKNMLIPLPPEHELAEMSAQLSSVDSLLTNKQSKLSHVDALKKSLMQDLLTGKVRVKIEEKEKEPVVA